MLNLPVRKAVIPAAGLGTRMLPATKAIPKEMLPVLDRPAIHYAMVEAAAAGIEDVAIITRPGKDALRAYFERETDLESLLAERGRTDLARQLARTDAGCRVVFVEQEAPRGLGDAVACARAYVGDEPFAVLLPDVLIERRGGTGCLAELAAAWHGDPLIAVHEVAAADVRRYGIVAPAPGAGRRVADLVEKPEPAAAPSRLAVTGRYLLTPDVFAALAETAPGRGGEIQLTDALRLLLVGRALRWARFTGIPHDLGCLEGWLGANLALARQRGLAVITRGGAAVAAVIRTPDAGAELAGAPARADGVAGDTRPPAAPWANGAPSATGAAIAAVDQATSGVRQTAVAVDPPQQAAAAPESAEAVQESHTGAKSPSLHEPTATRKSEAALAEAAAR